MVSHRARLTITTSAASGLVLGVVFLGMAWLTYSTELRSTRQILDGSLAQLVQDLSADAGGPDLKEVHEAYPAATFAYYRRGKLINKAGALPTEGLPMLRITHVGERALFSEASSSGDATLVGTMDWTQKESELRRLEQLLILLWFLMVALVGGVSWYAANATFRPLRALTAQASSLSGEDLSIRLDSTDRAEFGVFTDHLNKMLHRIRETALREERFASDAAHELRTPLAILRAKIETTLIKPRAEGEYTDVLASLIPEVDRLSRLVDLLLQSTQSGSDHAPSTELGALVGAVSSRWVDRFAAKGAHLKVQQEPTWAAIWPEEMQSVLENLLENALRYSPAASTCFVELRSEGDSVVLRVEDEGPGVLPETLPTIFDRLARGDEARSRAEGGHGIGLALCKRILENRRGAISAKNNDKGAEFKVTLPLAPLPS
jgi:signal transduction histidine kinase